jgi:hypothetical protein
VDRVVYSLLEVLLAVGSLSGGRPGGGGGGGGRGGIPVSRYGDASLLWGLLSVRSDEMVRKVFLIDL